MKKIDRKKVVDFLTDIEEMRNGGCVFDFINAVSDALKEKECFTLNDLVGDLAYVKDNELVESDQTGDDNKEYIVGEDCELAPQENPVFKVGDKVYLPIVSFDLLTVSNHTLAKTTGQPLSVKLACGREIAFYEDGTGEKGKGRAVFHKSEKAMVESFLGVVLGE